MNAHEKLLSQLPRTRLQILHLLKEMRGATLADIAERLGVTHEAVRQQMLQLQAEGFVTASSAAPRAASEPRLAGRRPTEYRLTTDGEHLLPKAYGELGSLLIEAAEEERALLPILERVAHKRAEQIPPAGVSMRSRLDGLSHLYPGNDEFYSWTKDRQGYAIEQRNCPFLTVALEHPHFCSTTVNAMRKHLGFEVTRTERFQDGDGRCLFRVSTGEPLRPRQRDRFRLETDR